MENDVIRNYSQRDVSKYVCWRSGVATIRWEDLEEEGEKSRDCAYLCCVGEDLGGHVAQGEAIDRHGRAETCSNSHELERGIIGSEKTGEEQNQGKRVE